jgi:hypothetical protein
MNTPIACDMTNAPDTVEDRMAEWGRLIAAAYTGRERTDAGIRLRFRADDGVEAWIRDLAAREKACCPFFDFGVSDTGDGEVWWDISVIDDDVARAVLDDVYGIPDTIGDGLSGMEERLRAGGLTVVRTGAVMEVRRPG